MKSRLSILWIALVSATMAFATDPSVSLTTYYANIDGKSNTSDALRTQLCTIISTGYTTIGYSSLPNDVYAASSNPSDFYNGASKTMEDIYSSYPYTASQAAASATTCGQNWNKEHTVPHSWFNEASPMESDAHHIFPTDIKMNSLRSSYPYGENNAEKECANYGYGHLGNSTFSGYSEKVFDPGDGGANGSYKGDLARVYFYMVTRYRTTNFTNGLGSVCFTYSGGVANLTDYMKNLMLKWHREDPVSEKERIRNNAIYAHQHNRNPFVDYPCLVEYIWGNKQGETVSLSALVSSYDASFSGEGCSCAEQPATPLVTATPGDGQITATWSDVSGATGYTVTIGTGVGYTTECASPSIGAITHSGTTNTCIITGLVNGLEYTVSVVANGTCDSEAGTGSATPTDTPIVCALTSISLNTTGVTKDFTTGDTFSSAGLVVTANYSNCASQPVTPTSISSPDMSSAGNKTVTVSYTESGVTKTATYQITVSDPVTYAIRFFNNGVQVGSTQNLIAGAVAVKPSDPTPCTSDYTFVGWWTAALAEDNTTTYSWVTDFTVSGAQDYYAVFSKTTEGGGTSKTYTLVLNGNNFAGSYAERSSSATANENGGSGTIDVNFTSNGVMKSSNSGNPIQFRKSGSGAGVLYNTTDLGTINSITYGGGSTNNIASTYKGTTAQPTSDGTGGYFKITNGASVSYITSITINFTKTTGSSTSYYTTAPSCVECTNKVTLTKGTPSNGSFSLDKADGEYENCNAGGFVVTVSDITPDAGYEFGAITQTGIASGVTIDQNAKTVTYAKDVTGSSTINVTFNALPTYAIRFFNNGAQIGSTQNLIAGAVAVKPSDPTPCTSDYTFVGWWTAALAEDNTTTYSWVTDFTVTGAQDYYAVYSKTEGGGSLTPATLEASYSSHTGWTISGTGGSSYWILKEGASITSPVISDLSTVTSITFTARTYGGASYNTVNVTTGSTSVGSATASSTSMVSKTVNVSGLTGSGSLVFSSSTTSSANGPGINNIVINYATSGGGTTYYTTAPSCVECTNKVTLTKGTPSNGSFSLDKADGEYNNCDADFVVTVSDITPAAGYYCTGVTATGDHVSISGPDGSGNYTVTYTHGYSITSTITANFAASPTYTATFMNCGVAYGSAQTTYAGNDITAPAGTPEACEEYTFVGWVAAAQTSETTELPETVTFPQPMPVGGITYYALYRRIEGGSGSTNVVLNTSAQYTNGQEAGSKEIDGVTFAFAIGGNSSNAPKYYSSGTSVRMYSDNTLTISSASTISAIEFVWGGTTSAGLEASEEEYNANTTGGSWSGSATSITFTVGSSGQQHIQTITVTIDGGGTSYYTTAPTCSGYVITVAEVLHGEGTSDKKRCDEGGTVTITLTANEGYECGGISTDPVVTPSGSGCTYTFTMPASDITVTPVFTPKTPRTFTFVPGTGICATTELSEGVWNTGVILPTATANSGCDPEYVFAGWATDFVSETEIRPTLYKAGENYNGENLTLYAVYAQTSGGSGSGFTLSYTKDDVTYYVTERTGTNKYLDASTDVAEAARFSLVTYNDKQFLCWHGTEDTYIYTGTGNKTDLSFTTDITSAVNGWDVTETDATLKLQSNGNNRYFMFNTNQKDRYAAYAVEGALTKGGAGTTTYNSAPSCVCTSVDITYNANGGTLAEGCENVTGGDCERDWKLCDAPTREDYIFTGWKDQAGNLYEAGATITDLKISLTMTAQWIPAPYTVLFDAGTGTCIESLTEASRGDGITLPKAEPSAACADDWTFIGWSATKLVGEENTTATIIGVSGVTYLPAANNTTLYAIYRRVDTDYATEDYTRVTDATPDEGDYVIVVARSDESFGKLTYGTLSTGRLTFTKDYTALPATISSPTATEIWHLTYDAEGYAYLYNVDAGAYLAASGYYITYDAYAGSAFVFTRDPGTYGDFKCLNNTASAYDNYYLGANKDANYIRYYSSSSLVSLYSVTLYQGSAGTRYYSTEPQCTPCTDPEWSFALGTSVVKSKGSAPFINTVNKVYDSAGTVTYSSTNEAVATVDNTGLVTLVGTGITTITLRLTRAMPYCAAVLQYELEVKEPSIDAVGVTADGEIIVEHDLDGTVTLDLSEGKTISTGTAANDIFFSKYFEAASHMKLFALFNGTGHDVDLSHIRVRCNCTTAGTGVWPKKTGDLGYVELSNVSKLREQYPKMKIPSGTELIFWSNNKGSTSSTQTYNKDLRDCIEIVIGDMTYHYSDMEAGEIPNWYCLGDYTTYNTKDEDGNNQFIFNGDDSMILERYDEATGTWVAIDLFGAGTSDAPASTEGLVEKITEPEYEINGEMQALNDDEGFHATCTEDPDEIPLSTNRYMLIRKNSVLDGLTAVASNTTSFATLCSEWDGRPVGGAGGGSNAYCNSGNKFSDIGEYDYAENYIDWDGIDADQYTVTENSDGTVSITFKEPNTLDKRACDLLKIEVRDETDPTKVLAASEYKIPIVVKSGDVLTSADLFHNQGDKCATCDVAILGEAVLTKATDGTTNDMPTVRDIYVYGGGKLVIPSGTHYNAHDLILRTQVADDKINMNVPNVQVNGSLTNQYGGAIRMQTRVGTTRFYQFAVPYVVRLEDVTFSDGTPAEYGKDFMIRYYDGEQRAINLGTVSNWRNYEGTELYPGVGYTLAVAKKTGHEQRELIFPMSGASLVDGEPATKATTIHAWGDNSIRANHRGWNFLSNPYLTTYAQNNLDEDAGGMLTTGQLVADPEHPGWWINDEGIIPYVTIINGSRTDYTQERVSLQDLPPFTTFFIQAGDDSHNQGEEFSLTFNKDHRVAAAPAYIRAAQNASVARFGVLLNGNNAQDNCGMVIGENYSAAYDMQADLSKEFGSAYSLKLYTLQEDEMQLAFQATHPDSLNKPVPVGVRLPANAEYTFSIDRRYNLGAFEHIYLTDNITGQHTDLLEGNYSFSGTKQQNNTRFSLFVQLRKNVPTGTDNLLNGIYAVGRDGSVMLTGLPETAAIYIYDMSGRMVLTRQTQGVTSVTYRIPAGVYQIRVQAERANALLRTIVY